jgi:hypothetical protein
LFKRHSGARYCLPLELLEQVRTRAGNLLLQTSQVGDEMFYGAKFKRAYVIGGGGFVGVFQDSDPSQEPASLAHLPTAQQARTGLLVPALQMLTAATSHALNRPAARQLFKARPLSTPAGFEFAHSGSFATVLVAKHAKTEGVVRFTVSVPQALGKQLDRMTRQKGYDNRSMVVLLC